jgi:predicted ArsR family transcriptional regulator
MSASRAALLDLLEAQPEPTTLGALVSATGLHANTVREHLEALEREGLVTRTQAAPRGRGRPAWLYQAASPEQAPSEYAGLASALAASLQRTSAHPEADAVAAGVDWGHQLAAGRGVEAPSTAAGARRAVVALLDDIGFAPQPNERGTVVRLTRCPLLEAAHKYPDIVCGVHLGLVRGALEEYGADPEGTDLLPFAEPGACRLHLAARKGRGR